MENRPLGLLDWQEYPKTMQELAKRWENCTKCKALTKDRKSIVMGDPRPEFLSHPYPKVMAVGQAPGANEDEIGLPFQGRPGQICRQYLHVEAGIDPDDCYLTNVLACKPLDGEYGPVWRGVWVQNCWDMLEASISIMRPKIIICMGRNAAIRFGCKGSMDDMRRRIFVYKRSSVITTGFPGQVLHCQRIQGYRN